MYGDKMKRFLGFFWIIILMLSGCGKREEYEEKKLEWWEEELLEYNLDNFTLEEKIGQMIIISSSKKSYDEEMEGIIKRIHPGGFIIMGENITTYDETLRFVRAIKQSYSIPLFIAIDEEGGRVQRLRNFSDVKVADVPYMYYLGKTGNESLAYQVGDIIAKQVKTLGVNLDFTPVLDIYSNPKNEVIGYRSFGSNKDIVSKMGMYLRRGLEDNGVMSCVKHFPGHGDTETDSHLDLPIIDKSYEVLLSNELVPFKEAINDGVSMIMIGHIALPKITGDNTPATLSRDIVTGILRDKLNYKGIIITDGLGMQGVNKGYKEEEVYVMAIKAGVDILLSPRNPDTVMTAIKEAVDRGIITEDRINDSVKRILLYKQKFIKDNMLDKSYLNREEYKKVLEQIPVN